MNVTACLVTRGDVDMQPILDSLSGIDVELWNNSVEDDAGVYGRYLAVGRATHDIVYVQDDDCLLTAEAIDRIVTAYEPGRIVANMPPDFRAHYTDSCLVGFGAVFDRDLPARAFERYRLAEMPWDRRLRPDVVFTALTPFTLVDVPFEHLPYAFGPDRMYRQRGHALDRQITLSRARRVHRALA